MASKMERRARETATTTDSAVPDLSGLGRGPGAADRRETSSVHPTLLSPAINPPSFVSGAAEAHHSYQLQCRRPCSRGRSCRH